VWNRFSEEEHEIISRQVQEMLDHGFIARAYSPWCANVVLAPKKGGKELRFCTDYRQLNKVTEFHSYYIPRVEDILDSLRGSKVFHTLDALAEYWQIKMKESDGSDLKTAFVTRDGVFIYKRMPFGLKNAPQEFSRLMDELFGHMRKKVAVYIDDITPHGKSGREANANLREVPKILRMAGLKLKISKCRFLYNKISLLGFIVTPEGIQPDPDKVDSIINMPTPNTVSKLRSFLGMINFYRKGVYGIRQVFRLCQQKLCRNLRSQEFQNCCHEIFVGEK
jgi:hypothetical protein